jgi:hypothetical protein
MSTTAGAMEKQTEGMARDKQSFTRFIIRSRESQPSSWNMDARVFSG